MRHSQLANVPEDEESFEELWAAFESLPDQYTRRPLDVLDVAALIRQECEARGVDCDSLKLQKLCYFVQGAALAEFRTPAFEDRIEAWVHGPVVRKVWSATRRDARPDRLAEALGDYNVARNDEVALKAVNHVINQLGHWSGSQLRELAHNQQPWVEARRGLTPTQGSDRTIPLTDMLEFFSEQSMIPAGDD